MLIYVVNLPETRARKVAGKLKLARSSDLRTRKYWFLESGILKGLMFAIVNVVVISLSKIAPYALKTG